MLIRARTSWVPTIVDERQLRELRVGSEKEGPKREQDADIYEEENVSSTTRVLVLETNPEGMKTEPEKGRDDSIARCSNECAREPGFFGEELGWRLVWSVGHEWGANYSPPLDEQNRVRT